MPANATFCPQCGHTNTSIADAASPLETASPFATPMDPGMFATGPAPAAATPPAGPAPTSPMAPASPMWTPDAAPSAPHGGAPTVNIGQNPQPPLYRAETPATPPEQPVGPPPTYSPYPMQPQAQPQPQPGQPPYPYAPPPGSQYGPQTEAFPQYGGSPQLPVQPYSNTPQPTTNYQYQPQVGVAGVPPRDPTVAALLELLGYIGFLGIGHIYAGRVTRGIALMVGWWIYWAVTAVLLVVLIGFCFALLGLAGPILSALWIKSDIEKENALARQRYQ
jgi:hypothetical protein